MGAPTKQIKFSKEYADFLERTRDSINTNCNLNLGLPDVTRILLHSNNEPRLIFGVRRRPGRGGNEAIFK